jgi:hypothetical protein
MFNQVAGVQPCILTSINQGLAAGFRPLMAGRHKHGTAEAEKQMAEGEQTSSHLTEEVDFTSQWRRKKKRRKVM